MGERKISVGGDKEGRGFVLITNQARRVGEEREGRRREGGKEGGRRTYLELLTRSILTLSVWSSRRTSQSSSSGEGGREGGREGVL